MLVGIVPSEWCEAYPDMTEFRKPATLDKMVMEGKFGQKTGKGFYDYK